MIKPVDLFPSDINCRGKMYMKEQAMKQLETSGESQNAGEETCKIGWHNCLGKGREMFKDDWPDKMWFKVGSTDWISSI